MGCDSVDWIKLAYDLAHWQAFFEHRSEPFGSPNTLQFHTVLLILLSMKDGLKECHCIFSSKVKVKLSRYAMEGHRGRGGIAPTHS
jgi:hypothetical protein